MMNRRAFLRSIAGVAATLPAAAAMAPAVAPAIAGGLGLFNVSHPLKLGFTVCNSNLAMGYLTLESLRESLAILELESERVLLLQPTVFWLRGHLTMKAPNNI
jgi:hypothetical protein